MLPIFMQQSRWRQKSFGCASPGYRQSFHRPARSQSREPSWKTPAMLVPLPTDLGFHKSRARFKVIHYRFRPVRQLLMAGRRLGACQGSGCTDVPEITVEAQGLAIICLYAFSMNVLLGSTERLCLDVRLAYLAGNAFGYNGGIRWTTDCRGSFLPTPAEYFRHVTGRAYVRSRQPGIRNCGLRATIEASDAALGSPRHGRRRP